MTAIRAHSVALTAFGGDSAIELMSAAVVLGRFRSPRWITEQFASKITDWLLVGLAAYIAARSLYTLIAAKPKPEPSYVGIGLLVAAALVMPWLGRRKRQLAIATKSSALQADAPRVPCAPIYLGSYSPDCSSMQWHTRIGPIQRLRLDCSHL